MKKLLLLDGNALMHRAYHALPPLNSPQGWQVNAVYGFFSILLSTLRRHQPRYLASAFDVKGKTFRDKLFKQYKAKRIKPPQEFYNQIPIIKKLLRIMEVPILEKRGYEADDVIGSIVCALSNSHPHVKILIVTSDMDALQLIKNRVQVLSFQRGVSQEKIWGKSQVREKYGFPPQKMIDYKALSGDPADNIPGVAGVGPKTAQNLLSNYKNLDMIYSHLAQLKPALARKLIKDKKLAYLSQKLATIKRDLKINFRLPDAEVHDFEQKQLEAEFAKLGFKSLIKRLPQSRRKQARQTKLL